LLLFKSFLTTIDTTTFAKRELRDGAFPSGSLGTSEFFVCSRQDFGKDLVAADLRRSAYDA